MSDDFLSKGRGAVIAVGLLSCLTASPGGAQESSAAQSKTEALAINLDELSWGPPGGGDGVPDGTRTARMGVDPETGGITYYALFPAGTHFDAHWHSHDEFVSVQRGSVTITLGEEQHRVSAGAYIVIPGGMVHAWDIPASGEVVILVRRAGPADFHFVAD